jgi:hypothetical protein
MKQKARKKRVRPQSRGTRNIRRQLQREIYRELGLSRGKPTLTATNQRILRILHPTFDQKKAMYSIAHDFSILPAGSRPKFVEMKKVNEILMQNPRIKQIVETHPRLGQALPSMVESTLSHRGFKRTTELWMKRNAIKAGIKTIDDRAKGYSERMNLKMGEVGSQLVKGLATPVILDIGTGAGSTIISIVNKMPPEQRANAKIVISDVITTGLKDVKKYLASMGVKPENVIVLPTGFNHVATMLRTMKRQPFLKKESDYMFKKKLFSLLGKVDLVVSGATFNCFPEAKGILRAAKKLMKKGGSVAIWDWAGIETAAKALTKKQLTQKLFVTEGKAPTGRENFLAFSQYWLRSYILDERKLAEAFERLERDLRKSQRFDFINWAKRNQDLFEKDWKKIEGKGRRQRGYRTTGQLAADMNATGLEVERVFFPLYEANKITQGANQYIVIAKK